MAHIVAVRREADGSVVLTVREEREVVIQPKDAVKPKADLRALARAAHAADKLTEAEALVAEKKGKPGRGDGAG